MREDGGKPDAFCHPSSYRSGLLSSIGLSQTCSEALLQPIAAEGETPQTYSRKALLSPSCKLIRAGSQPNAAESEWMELDLEYIDQWSLLLDLSILIRTIPVVLKGSGAS